MISNFLDLSQAETLENFGNVFRPAAVGYPKCVEERDPTS